MNLKENLKDRKKLITIIGIILIGFTILITTGIFVFSKFEIRNSCLRLSFDRQAKSETNFNDQKAGNYIIFNNENNTKLTVEIADTPKEREIGLMNREYLDENSGMIFIFDKEDFRSFWMKNTIISLDMIFVDSNLKIINIENSTEPNQTIYRYNSLKEAKYVIETNGGWCDENNINSGIKIELYLNDY